MRCAGLLVREQGDSALQGFQFSRANEPCWQVGAGIAELPVLCGMQFGESPVGPS